MPLTLVAKTEIASDNDENTRNSVKSERLQLNPDHNRAPYRSLTPPVGRQTKCPASIGRLAPPTPVGVSWGCAYSSWRCWLSSPFQSRGVPRNPASLPVFPRRHFMCSRTPSCGIAATLRVRAARPAFAASRAFATRRRGIRLATRHRFRGAAGLHQPPDHPQQPVEVAAVGEHPQASAQQLPVLLKGDRHALVGERPAQPFVIEPVVEADDG